MMVNAITTIFNNQKPKLTITGIYKLSDDEYVVEALEDPSIEDYGDPFYKIDVKTKTVINYLPIADLDRFIESVEKRTIYKR